ncbi:MAG: Na(+)/H(+) antiporter subunit D [Rhodospirillaceae bacterium]|nr:Na(+)/H(+) antiporter subunit D [Rhodospirillaceae bacterium]
MMSDFLTMLPPGALMMIVAAGLVLVPHHVRQVVMLLAIAGSAFSLTAGAGQHLTVALLGFEMMFYRADHLSLPFAIVFHIAAALNVFYGWHEKRATDHVAGLAYAGAALAALHAGDLITLFIWWEATAITSVFLILASGTQRARHAAMRYLIIQVASGVLLLAGAAMLLSKTGSLAFVAMTLGSTASWLIFIAFGIKAAFPLLNGWLQDAYPEATVVGTVVLSAFTTKLAIYALARGFAGTELLIVIGCLMTAFPVFFAVIENDMRRVLAYSLNNQLGFMVVAIGIGTDLAINGAVAHAFAHIIYKGLLFMSMGAVLYRVGTVKASELGGLYKSMPLTMVFCVVGAMSISAFPLFSGFAAKSLIMSALGYEGLIVAYLVLLAASAGVLHHSGIKIPYFAFFGHDGGHKLKEAPFGMLVAMAGASALCIGIGSFPAIFYQILPYSIDYNPYDASHVLGQMELLIFSILAFTFLMRFGFYPPELKSTVLNTDWLYRRVAVWLGRPILLAVMTFWNSAMRAIAGYRDAIWQAVERLAHAPITGPTVPGRAVLVQTALLAALLAIGYLVAG